MTLDESIKHEEEIANEYEKNAKHIREKMKSDIALSNADDLDKYAKNHRQIAGWLRELKTLKEHTGHWITLKDEWGDIHEAVCSYCDANGNHKWHYCPNCGAKMEVE